MAEHLRLQSGVVSRAQLLADGLGPHDLRRLVRRRELNRLFPGVYVDHTGTPSWVQRAWAGVLVAWPAALSGATALRAANGPGLRGFDEAAPIEVAVDRHRHVAPVDGLIVTRMVNLRGRVQWNLSPPRVRLEEAVVDAAAAARDDFDAVATITRAINARLTTAARLIATVRGRRRLRRRAFLFAALDDIAQGTCSVLEHAYLHRVERPHGLPRPSRQVVATSRGRIYRDVEYAGHGLVVELDGRVDHLATEARDSDLDRDLDALIDGRITVRLGWGQVLRRPCSTAARVHHLLTLRAETPPFERCPDC